MEPTHEFQLKMKENDKHMDDYISNGCCHDNFAY